MRIRVTGRRKLQGYTACNTEEGEADTKAAEGERKGVGAEEIGNRGFRRHHMEYSSMR